MNVVSTSPSGTEVLCALGVGPVAVSHACDHPPRVQELPSMDFSRVRGESSVERLAACLHPDEFGPPPADVAALSAERPA